MLPWIDRWIEKKMRKALHSRRERLKEKSLQKFQKKHPGIPIADLRERIDKEAARVYPLADNSILKARLLQARIGFWLAAVGSILIVGTLGGFTGGTAIPFLAPLLGILVTWSVVIATIPANYNYRIQGGLDSVVALYEEALAIGEQNDVRELEVHYEGVSSQAQILEFIEAHPDQELRIRVLSRDPEALAENKQKGEGSALSESELIGVNANDVPMETCFRV